MALRTMPGSKGKVGERSLPTIQPHQHAVVDIDSMSCAAITESIRSSQPAPVPTANPIASARSKRYLTSKLSVASDKLFDGVHGDEGNTTRVSRWRNAVEYHVPTTWRQWLVTVACLVIGIAISTVVFVILTPETTSGPKAYFRYSSSLLYQEAVSTLTSLERVTLVSGVLDGTAGVSNFDFERAAKAMTLNGNIEALRHLSYYAIASDSERANAESVGMALYGPNFTITEMTAQGTTMPHANTSWYYPLLFISPSLPFEGAMGFDIASIPVYNRTATTVRTTGRASATDPIIIPGADGQLGMMLMSPVLSNSSRPVGIFGASYDFSAFMNYVLLEPEAAVRQSFQDSCLSVYLSDIKTARLLYERHYCGRQQKMENDSDASVGYRLGFADRTLYLALARKPYDAPAVPITIFVIMLLGTLAITGFVLHQLKQRQRIRQHHERALREHAKRVRAEQDSTMKSAFVSNMSHELRTPLNGLIGTTELLLQSKLSPAQLEHLHTMEICSRTLLNTINDILDWSKVESGHMVLDRIPVDVYDLLHDVYYMGTVQAREKKLVLEFIIRPSVWYVYYGDQIRLMQVVANLVTNALKFTSPGGAVVVEVSAEPCEPPDAPVVPGLLTADKDELLDDGTTPWDLIHVSVKDTGIGISSNVLPLLFTAFKQSDSSTTREFGGTGLGLAISRRLACMMHGNAWAESTLGVGSTFHFTARLARCHAYSVSRFMAPRRDPITGCVRYVFTPSKPDTAVLHNDDDTGPVLPLSITPADSTTGLEAAVAADDGVSAGDTACAVVTSLADAHSGVDGEECDPSDLPRKPHVLLVEDNPISQKVAGQMLESMGCTVDKAWNGLECLEKCQVTKYDIVFLDVQMPVCDGFEAIMRLRVTAGPNQTTPVIALTANAMESDRERCIEKGMSDFLSKPCNFDKLSTTIKRWLPWCHLDENHRAARTSLRRTIIRSSNPDSQPP